MTRTRQVVLPAAAHVLRPLPEHLPDPAPQHPLPPNQVQEHSGNLSPNKAVSCSTLTSSPPGVRSSSRKLQQSGAPASSPWLMYLCSHSPKPPPSSQVLLQVERGGDKFGEAGPPPRVRCQVRGECQIENENEIFILTPGRAGTPSVSSSTSALQKLPSQGLHS